MRCNPWRWLWGVIPIAMLSWVTFHWEQSNIEADLTRRTHEALEQNGLGWAVTGFSGRDAVLTGRATDEAEPKAAFDAVKKTWGVRIVEPRTDLVDKVDTFAWSAAKTDNKIKLSGFVPNEETRKSVIGAAKASFPKAAIDDAMQLARGAPSRDLWLSGISFGLKQLASLKRGTVDLEGSSLSIAGEAADFAGYKSVRAALATGMPKGWRIGRDKVTGPVVSPFTWSAKLAASQLVLSGHVPGETIRDALFAQAKKAFPKHAIVDRMETAEGAPDGWSKAAAVSIDQLYQLKEGTAEMRGKDLSLTGVAEDEAMATAVRKAFKSGAPSSFKTSEKITFLKPTLPVASPFTTSIEGSGNGVMLTGYVPSEAARAALVAAVKSRLPGKSIKDRLQVAAGAPDGWQPCILAGVAGVGRLGGGTAELSDRRLLVTGQAKETKTGDAIATEVTTAAGRACEAVVRIASAAPQAAAPVAGDDGGARRAELDRRWAEAEARWAAMNDAYDRDRTSRDAAPEVADDSAAEAQRKAALEARWREAEARWAATNDVYERERADAEAARQREAGEAERRAAEAAKSQRSSAAGKCQKLLTDAATEGVILFQRASADLNAKSTPTLQRLVKIVNACPEFRVEIEGHTDGEGLPERNQKLSERRAQTIVSFLTRAGVVAARLSAVGYGADRPIAPNDTPENMAKNRRIEFSVIAN